MSSLHFGNRVDDEHLSSDPIARSWQLYRGVRECWKYHMETCITVLEEREWLKAQPEFQGGWEAGCDWFESQIDKCAFENLTLFVQPPFSAALLSECRDLLAKAFLYHWNAAVLRVSGKEMKIIGDSSVSGKWVLRTLQAAKRPTTPEEVLTSPRLLGGNPLQDLVLALCAIQGSSTALQRLASICNETYDREFRRGFAGEDLPVTWEDLLSHLVIPRESRAIPPLAQFRGYAILRKWLQRVVRNFLLDASRKQASQKNAERRFAENRPRQFGDKQREISHKELAHLLNQLEDRDRRVLLMSFYEDLPISLIGKELGISPGHVSRLRQDAIAQVRQLMYEANLLRYEGN